MNAQVFSVVTTTGRGGTWFENRQRVTIGARTSLPNNYDKISWMTIEQFWHDSNDDRHGIGAYSRVRGFRAMNSTLPGNALSHQRRCGAQSSNIVMPDYITHLKSAGTALM